jgi:hypothetical protein
MSGVLDGKVLLCSLWDLAGPQVRRLFLQRIEKRLFLYVENQRKTNTTATVDQEQAVTNPGGDR